MKERIQLHWFLGGGRSGSADERRMIDGDRAQATAQWSIIASTRR
jgi:hypothetical protein